MEEGRWDEAASFLEEVLRSHPTNILALNRLGETCICGGDFSRALDIYLRVGEVHEETGALRKAVIAYRLALRIFPRNGDVATRLAGALVKLGHSEEASGYFRLALSIFDEHGRFAQVARVLSYMVARAPCDPDLRVRLAETLLRIDRNVQAVEMLAEGARLLREQGRVEDFVIVAERTLYLDAGRTCLRRELARVHLQKGSQRRALEELERCHQDAPDDVETLVLLAPLLRDVGELERAFDAYGELARAFSRVPSPGPHESLSVAQLTAGSGGEEEPTTEVFDLPDGVAETETIAELMGQADLYTQYGFPMRAMARLREVLNIDPSHPRAREKLREIEALTSQPGGVGQSVGPGESRPPPGEGQSSGAKTSHPTGRIDLSDLQDGLEEVYFFMAQDLHDEASQVLGQLEDGYSGDPRLVQVRAQLDAHRGRASDGRRPSEESD